MKPEFDDSTAPIDYDEFGRSYQVVRAVGGILIALVGVLTLRWHIPGSSHMIVPGAVIAVHALGCLRRGCLSAYGSLLVDASLAGGMILLVGQPDATAAVALLYLLFGALLLLPPKRGTILGLYTAVWTVAVLLWAPLAVAGQYVQSNVTAFSRIGAGVLLGVVVVLLVVASRSFLGARSRHQLALQSEREAVRLKNEFVSIVSHELRTPLTSIAGFVETLRDEWDRLEASEIDEFLGIVQSETQHLSHLVEDVLVIPRIEAGRLPLKMEEFELRPVVHHITEVLAAEYPGRAAAVAIPAGIYVKADPQRMQQVVRNLVTNAFRYGGDQILIEGDPGPRMMEVVVSDNGIGVAEKDRDRIFEHFEQGSMGDDRSATGIGLGLPIARRLIRVMGGDLWYEPRFPTGSRFCFTVKLVTAATAEQRSAAQAHPPERQTKPSPATS